MRLLSNFDTQQEHTLIKEYKKGFGDENVLSLHKSRRFYVMKVVLPLAVYAIIFSLGLYLVYMIEFEFQRYAQWAFWIVMLLYLLVVGRSASAEYINWKMDYLIVTPKEVVKYNQSGVFHRETGTIHVDKIKSVTVSKHGIANSFLDIGTITFLAEGEDNKGDIIMPYIDAVDQVEKKIRTIMGMNGMS